MIKQCAQAIAYAQNALSFLFLDARISSFIRAVYLYGSAVRGELTKESDVDIFVDCSTTHETEVQKHTTAAFVRFSQSHDHEKWKQMGFSYPLSVQAGDINQWQLKSSIMAEGILLYTNKAEAANAERHVLFVIKLPKNKKKYLSITRQLFGRKERMQRDAGLLGTVHGQKVSSHVFLVPKENQHTILQFLAREKADYSMKEICLFQ